MTSNEIIETVHGPCVIHFGHYLNGQNCVSLHHAHTGAPVARLSINMAEISTKKIPSDVVYIKTCSENRAVIKPVFNSGLFTKTNISIGAAALLDENSIEIWTINHITKQLEDANKAV